MELNGHFDQKAEELYTSCDILLIRLYFKMEVVCGFPDVPEETVEVLQELGLLTRNEKKCYITSSGRLAVNQGGIKRYLEAREVSSGDFLILRGVRVFTDHPIFVGLLFGLLMLICLLTWMGAIFIY